MRRISFSWKASALLLLGGTCLFTILFAVFLRPRQPSFNGQTATEWFKQAQISGGGEHPEALKPIAEAFRNMGPPGLKFLLEQLAREDSRAKRQFVKAILHAPIQNRFRGFLSDWDTSNVITRHIAVDLLAALGPFAEASLPALTNACRDEDPSIAANARVAIEKIAPPAVAIPILVASLADRRPGSLAAAAFSLYNLAQNPENDCTMAIPALRAGLQSPDERAWFEAARALSKIDPEHSAPLLLPNISKTLSENPLQHHRWPVRVLQIWSLNIIENLGPTAKECVPVLSSLTNSADAMVRDAALRALKRCQDREVR